MPGREPARPMKDGPCLPVSVATRPRSGGSGGSGGVAGDRRRGGGDRDVLAGRGPGRVGDLRADLEDAGGQVVVALEPDGHLVEDLVALVVDVLGDHVGELAGQLVGPLAEVLEVGAAEADDVDVGRQDAALAEDRALLVGLALEGLGDLGGVHLALEDAGERQADHALEASLEALQHTHSRSFAFGRTSRCANGDRSRAARRDRPGTRDAPHDLAIGTVRRRRRAGQRPTPRPGHGPLAANVVARQGKWRNGRRARFRSVCPKGRGGSTPPLPTQFDDDPARPGSLRERGTFVYRAGHPAGACADLRCGRTGRPRPVRGPSVLRSRGTLVAPSSHPIGRARRP